MLSDGNYLPNPLQQLGGQFSTALQSTGPWGSTVATPGDGNMPVGDAETVQSLSQLAASIPGTATGQQDMSALGNPAPVMADLNKAAGQSPLGAMGRSVAPSSPGMAGMQGYSQLLAQQAGQLPALQQQQQSNRATLLQALNNLSQQQANYVPPSQVNQPLLNMAAGFAGNPNMATGLAAGLAGYGDAATEQAAVERAQNDKAMQTQLLTAQLPEKFSEEDIKNSMDAAKEGLTAEKMQQMLAMQLPGGVPQSGSSQVHGDDLLKSLPDTEAAQVKALAEGRMQFPSGFALKSPYWQQMLSAVSQYDPNFDAVNYNARNKTYQDFTSGKSAQNLTALNTAMGHLETLDKDFSKLNNSDLPWVNPIANSLAINTGNKDVQGNMSAVGADASGVSNELAKVFRSTGMSQKEVQDWEDKISANSSPSQMQGTIKSAINLMNSRIDSLGEQYNKGMGTSKNGIELLSPEAQLAYAKLTGIPPKTTVAQGAGTHISPNDLSPQSSSRVKVITPDGAVGTIDSAHLQDFMQSGGKLAQ